MNVKELREKAGLTQEELAAKTRIPRDRIAKWEQGKGSPKSEDEKTLTAFFGNFKREDVPHEKNTAASKSIRKPKIDLNETTDGITFIPISAQAGYSKRTMDPIFNESLEKLYIPGFPYRGDNYRIWEVEGNSMEPTFKEHFFVLTERIEHTSWHQAKDYHVYVIVTIDDVYLKRVFKKNKNEWVLISDNEELYPQFIFPFSQIKELWVVKRKMDWEMSPPKRFEIKV